MQDNSVSFKAKLSLLRALEERGTRFGMNCSHLYPAQVWHTKPLSEQFRHHTLRALESRLSLSKGKLTHLQPLNPFWIPNLSWVWRTTNWQKAFQVNKPYDRNFKNPIVMHINSDANEFIWISIPWLISKELELFELEVFATGCLTLSMWRSFEKQPTHLMRVPT